MNILTKVIYHIKEKSKRDKLFKKCKCLLFNEKEIKVLEGPFAGMVYSSYHAAGSALWPKLLGTYEKELNDIIIACMDKHYNHIIDIGSAEGYYAIGFALCKNSEDIIAFDIDKKAIHLLNEMCRVNEVNIKVRDDLCTKETLKEISFDGDKKSLILCDCEGYERDLFGDIDSKILKNVELLIEIHDWCQYDTPTQNIIIENFTNTHSYQIIDGIDDYEKAYLYKIDCIKDFSIGDRYELLKEGRKRLGKWIYLTPKAI